MPHAYRRITVMLAMLGLFCSGGSGQQSQESRSAERSFEVAAIKPNNSGDRRTGFLPLSGDRFMANNVTVRQLIQFSYKLQDFQIIGGPAWTEVKRFNVEAKVPSNTTADEVPSMMQSLLRERFHLRAHMDKKSLPVYSLGVGNSGSKLRDAAPCASPSATNPCSGIAMQPEGRLIGRTAEMQQVVGILSYLLSRPVLDDTHLTGKYDFDLRWRPDSLTTPFEGNPNDHVEPDDPDIFAALQQQLGLKIKSGKAPATVLRIDLVEEPTEN
jgi:uncharacterized protein (TIGR03435 family)